MYVSRVPDYPPPIDQVRYVPEGGVGPEELDPLPAPRKLGPAWAFGAAGLLLGALAAMLVAPAVRPDVAPVHSASAITLTQHSATDVDPDMATWTASGEVRHEAEQGNGYSNPLPIFLVSRP